VNQYIADGVSRLSLCITFALNCFALSIFSTVRGADIGLITYFSGAYFTVILSHKLTSLSSCGLSRSKLMMTVTYRQNVTYSHLLDIQYQQEASVEGFYKQYGT
jgi:hypothetical protein